MNTTDILIEDPSLRDKLQVFRDRTEAGHRIASLLRDHIKGDEMIFAIPSGGVPVAAEMARILSLPLDLLIVRKIQIPWNTEAGFGALDPDGRDIINESLLARLGLSEEEVRTQKEKTKAVIGGRNRLFRNDRPFPDISGRTVILVDDGLASGYTMIAALRFIGRRKPAGTIVAVPTAPDRTIELLLTEVDKVVCPNVRTGFPFAVAAAYRDWYDLSDDEVLSLINRTPLLQGS